MSENSSIKLCLVAVESTARLGSNGTAAAAAAARGLSCTMGRVHMLGVARGPAALGSADRIVILILGFCIQQCSSCAVQVLMNIVTALTVELLSANVGFERSYCHERGRGEAHGVGKGVAGAAEAADAVIAAQRRCARIAARCRGLPHERRADVDGRVQAQRR